MRDPLDVETPRGDCSGDEDGHLAELEVCQSSLALPLEPVAVDGGRWEALCIQDIFREMGIMNRQKCPCPLCKARVHYFLTEVRLPALKGKWR